LNLEQILDRLREDPSFMANVTHWEVVPPRRAKYGPFPKSLHPLLRPALQEKGIENLYVHQSQAVEEALAGRDVVVVTPTASGKTLCYNLPVLSRILREGEARALYLFPTKALAQDQLAELRGLIDTIGADVKVHTYDGDTPPDARKVIRTAGHIVVTNPDMLHTAILPHHTKWVKLFENLRYVVIDELHSYRGVFGSHMANVLRRLRRICRFYGSDPVYICCSATIANPAELAARLIGRPVRLVDENGAPSGEKHFIFYNPPVVNEQLGIRRSSLLEARGIASRLLRNGIQTIVFARTRLSVEVLVTYLKEALAQVGQSSTVRGYRGGYLPRERRDIERALRDGSVRGVVSTSALELGIDIGRLEACVMLGYPGSIASTWQRAGRAGRSTGVSAVFLVASSSPLDQYIITHPEYFFGSSVENGLINPDNLYILMNHLKCAAFELPFEEGEEFGVSTTEEILSYLEEKGLIHRVQGRWYWMADAFPAEEISLRSASAENFVVIDITEKPRVIGEVDRISAPLLLHEEAIYIHESVQYQVETLDYEEKKAYVRRVKVDYYTDASLAVDLQVLEVLQEGARGLSATGYGEVLVRSKPTMFKKIKLYTHENLGSGPIHLPEEQMHTEAYWLSLDESPWRSHVRSQIEAGLLGLANLLANIAPLYLMCDRGDLETVVQVRAPFTGRPTIFLYDRYPGGVGLAEKMFQVDEQVLRCAQDLVGSCSCADGCPSCTGPANEVGPGAKDMARAVLDTLLGGTM